MSADRSRAAWGAVGGAAAAVFAGLAWLVATDDPLRAVDAAAHRALYDALGAGRQPLVTAITWLGNNATLVTAGTLVGAAGLALRRPEWTVRVLAGSGAGAFVLRGLKALFARERPLDRLVEAAGWSFPSGHAFASTVFYGTVAVLVWRSTTRPAWRWSAAAAAALVALAVGLSRVYLGVHYLSDVAAGWAAGIAWLVATQQLVGDAVKRRAGRPSDPQSRQTESNSRNDAETSSPA